MHATIVKGFHKHTRAALSPEGRTPETIKILLKGGKNKDYHLCLEQPILKALQWTP